MRVLAGTGQCDAPGMMDGWEGRDGMGIELLAFVGLFLVPLHCIALRCVWKNLLGIAEYWNSSSSSSCFPDVFSLFIIGFFLCQRW